MRSPVSQAARARSLVIAVAILSTAACGGSRRYPAAEQQRAVVSFTNESMDKAEVYAVTSGQSVRLGTVFAGRTERLVVPPDVAFRGSNVNFVARLLARRNQPQSGPISLRPGDHLEVRLPTDQRQLVVMPASP